MSTSRVQNLVVEFYSMCANALEKYMKRSSFTHLLKSKGKLDLLTWVKNNLEGNF